MNRAAKTDTRTQSELGEIVYEQGFGFRGGLVVGFEIGHERFERGWIFTFDEDAAGGEAVFEGVLAGCGFTGLSAPLGFGSVSLRGALGWTSYVIDSIE
jgi:hypothetical protein